MVMCESQDRSRMYLKKILLILFSFALVFYPSTIMASEISAEHDENNNHTEHEANEEIIDLHTEGEQQDSNSTSEAAEEDDEEDIEYNLTDVHARSSGEITFDYSQGVYHLEGQFSI